MAIVEIPLNRYGLVGEQDPSKLKTGVLATAFNTDFASSGRILQKEGGATTNGTLAGNQITVGTEFWATPAIQRRVVASDRPALGNAALFKLDVTTGALINTLVTGLTQDRIGQFVAGGAEKAGRDAKLFFFNGADATQVLAADGATTANIANGAAEWTGANRPSFGFLFRSSLLAGGAANDPNRIYGSSLEDHEKFNGTDAYTILVYPGTGQKLVGGLSAFGRGFLFKYPNGIFAIDDTSTSTASWFTTAVTPEIGLPETPHAAIGLDESAVALLSHNGDIVLMQETSGTLTGLSFTNLTKALNLRPFIQANFDLSRIKYSQMFWYSDKRQLMVTFASDGSPVQNRILIFDFNYETVRVSLSNKTINNAIWGELGPNFIRRVRIGDDSGNVKKLDQTDRTVDGSPYIFSIGTQPSDFSDIDPGFARKKLFYRLHLEYIPTGNYTLFADYTVDGKIAGTAGFNMNAAGAVSVAEGLFRRSRDIFGEGWYFSIGLSDQTVNNPQIGRLWVEFEPTSMRL